MVKKFAASFLFNKMRFHAPDALNALLHMLMQEESYEKFCFEVSKQYRSANCLLHDVDIVGTFTMNLI